MLRLVLLSLALASASALVCLPDTCNSVKCAALTAQDCVGGSIVHQGGFCGCCDACVQNLAEGDRCMPMLLLGVPAEQRCVEGLLCDPHTLTCTKAQDVAAIRKRQVQTCAQRLQDIKSAQSNGMPLLGQFIPTCDNDGSYSAIQCHGSQCYCADVNGREISNYAAHISKYANMDCSCARDQNTYMKSGLIGKMFFCTSSGGYKNYKCEGSVCYCVDNLGAMKAGSTSVHISNIGNLVC